MRIEPDVYLVASGQMGFDLTDPYDSHAYLFDAGDHYLLFDVGTGRGIEQMFDICHQEGLDMTRPGHLFVTHAHADHAGGAAHVRDRAKLTVYASAATARILSVADAEATCLPAAQAAGVYPADYELRPCPVERVLGDGDVVHIGPWRVQSIETPGHSHDHMCYLVSNSHKRYLISGDALFYGGRIILQYTYDCSVPGQIAALQHLAEYDFDALLPGHLSISLQRGRRHLEDACAIIAKLGCPPSIL